MVFEDDSLSITVLKDPVNRAGSRFRIDCFIGVLERRNTVGVRVVPNSNYYKTIFPKAFSNFRILNKVLIAEENFFILGGIVYFDNGVGD